MSFKRLSLTEPQAWTVIGGFQALIAIAGWLLDQGLATTGGLVGVATAIAARWFVSHPLIEYVPVEAGSEGYEADQIPIHDSERHSHLINQNLLQALGEGAYTLYANPATLRYKDELRAVGQGFRRLIHGSTLHSETLDALATLHVAHDDPFIALCRAYTRIVNFNFNPDWCDESGFDENGHHIWPEDGREWTT